jgi:hypothetical protein
MSTGIPAQSPAKRDYDQGKGLFFIVKACFKIISKAGSDFCSLSFMLNLQISILFYYLFYSYSHEKDK